MNLRGQKETRVDENSTHLGRWNRRHFLLSNTEKCRMKCNKTSEYIAEARGHGNSEAPKMKRNRNHEPNTQEGLALWNPEEGRGSLPLVPHGFKVHARREGQWLWAQHMRELEVGHIHKGRILRWKGGPECHPLIDGGNKKHLSFSTWVWVGVLPMETSPHRGLGFKQNLCP